VPSCIIQVVLSPDRHILLHANQNSETIDVFYSGTGDTDNMDFSFVTHVSIPNPKGTNRKDERHGPPRIAFSADGAKFAALTSDGVVWVWDVRSKIPLKVFEADVPRDSQRPISGLQFSSGILGREVLVFKEVS
jgi:WD40 repeat protein